MDERTENLSSFESGRKIICLVKDNPLVDQERIIGQDGNLTFGDMQDMNG